MAQTSVDNAPDICFEGMVNTPSHENVIRSFAAAAALYPGKMVVINAATDVTLGAQSVKLVSAAGDVVAGRMAGVVVGDVTKQSTSLAYQEFVQYDDVPVMRKGRIWVVSADAVDNVTKGVWTRHANGAANPGAGLTAGTFRATTNADYTQVTAGMQWVAGTTIGSTEYGLLEVNFPS
jgi:hypothetical protein